MWKSTLTPLRTKKTNKNKIKIELKNDSGLTRQKSSTFSRRRPSSQASSSIAEERSQILSEESDNQFVDEKVAPVNSADNEKDDGSHNNDNAQGLHQSVIQEVQIEDEEDQIDNNDENQFRGGSAENGKLDLDRIEKVEKQNLVNEIIGRLPIEDILALKNGSVDDYINSHDIVVTKDNVETTYTFIKVTRKQSPCHPNRQH